jgi:hypothetical protein
MIADSTEELFSFVDKLGIQRKWVQGEGTYREHFDICLSKRKLAVQLGAKEITMREMGLMIRERRNASTDIKHAR